jgi:hypothetical protein
MLRALSVVRLFQDWADFADVGVGWNLSRGRGPVSLRLSVILAGLFIGLAAPSAHAYPAFTIDSVNLRAGPGVSFARLTTIAADTPIEVFNCRGSWCRVDYLSYAGWVSEAFIGVARRTYPPEACPPQVHRQPGSIPYGACLLPVPPSLPGDLPPMPGFPIPD